MIPATTNYTTAAAQNYGLKPVFAIDIEGYGRVFSNRVAEDFTPWISALEPCRQSIDPLEGSSTLGDLTFTVLDYKRLLTGDMPGFVFEGKRVQLLSGFPSLALADYALLWTGVINRVESAEDNTGYSFTCQDLSRLEKQVIYLTGDDGQPTSSDHPKTVVGNPLDILLSILRDYVLLADRDIDLTTITQARDELFGGIQFEFSITSPPEAKEFIEKELLKPLGGWGLTDNQGRYTVNFLQPLAGTNVSSFDFTTQNLAKLPTLQQSDLVNVVSYRFDSNGDKFMAETVEISGASATRYGQQGQQVIESQGVRSGFGGFSLAAQVARSIFARFDSKNPKLDLLGWWPACLLNAGDFVSVTHPLIPNRAAGVMGLTNQLFQVIERCWNFAEATVELSVIDAATLAAFGRLRIAPDAIPTWLDATEEQKARYLFIGNSAGKQSDGSDNGRLG